jgi:arsenate reductase (glutaredoxin)
MSLVVNGIPNCDTVKKARTWLSSQGIVHDFRDFKKDPPSVSEVRVWADAVGWPVLLNKAGTTFRKLPDADKADLDAEKAIHLMAAQPSLIKRPVVSGGPSLLVGFKPELWLELLG